MRQGPFCSLIGWLCNDGRIFRCFLPGASTTFIMLVLGHKCPETGGGVYFVWVLKMRIDFLTLIPVFRGTKGLGRVPLADHKI